MGGGLAFQGGFAPLAVDNLWVICAMIVDTIYCVAAFFGAYRQNSKKFKHFQMLIL
jgi:hypothetical protein